jgi:outer membrane receptor protein involved in Fe transport
VTTTTSPAGSAAPDAGATVGEVIVTAQRREETLQNVPVAVTALSGANLKSQRLESGADLELAVPNLTFSRAAFGATDYQIRGIGYQVVATAADTGVGVDENDVPLVVNRLADADFFDVERVEVLRGPQGTLYGRNATGGVINTITNKPTDAYEGSLTAEYGNYDSKRFEGFVNLPLNKVFEVRLAATYLDRDGYDINTTDGHRIDGRDLYSYRATIAFKPNDHFRSYLMLEHFSEDDSRFGGVKFVCAKDPGPTSVGGVAVTNAAAQGYLSRGCLDDSINSLAAQTGTVNTAATLGGALANLYGLTSGDANAGATQSANPRDIAEGIDPTYNAKNTLVELDNQWDLSRTLKLSSITAYSEDRLSTRAEFEPASIPFNVTPVTPGGVFDDPQTGPSQYLNLDEDYDNYHARQWTEEVRLQSAFAGPINFNAGFFYLHLNRLDDVYILSNAESAAAEFGNLLGGDTYVDPNATPDGAGHNYFYNRNPYTLNSKAGFGEVYWKATDTLRITAGVRYTDDEKSFVDYPVQLLAPGEGFPSSLVTQTASFKEFTGRFNVDWRPQLSYTDQTLVYASYSRGYKAGGFNAPNTIAVSPTYAPEFVNAFELGTKNTLLSHSLTLDLTGFYYDYTGYQISQVEGLNEQTVNVNAAIYGVEFETVWTPIRNLRLNATLGYLHTRIDGGQSIDIFNRTQNDPAYTYLKSLTSGCVGPTSAVAALVGLIDSGAVPAAALTEACGGAFASSNPSVNPLAPYGVVIPVNAGVPVNLAGKQLPNAPQITLTLGAQYRYDLGRGWMATLRGDYYHQGSAYSDIYNDPANALEAWDNINLSLDVARPAWQLDVQVYCKNLLNLAVATGVGVDSEALGVSRSVNYLDPRLFGISITKRFH